MFKQLARIVAVGALTFGSISIGGPANAAIHTGPVPAEWGDPGPSFATIAVVGRQNGHIKGRLGNQHVIEVDTLDEESVINGSVVDWRCPKGVTAPLNWFDPTTCKLKSQVTIDFDYEQPTPLVENWSPTLRYLNFRIPIVFRDFTTGAIVAHSKFSLHVKAEGEVTQTWGDDDYMDVFMREGAHVTGGKFMGKPWLQMSSVEVIGDQMWLLRYYDGV
jgi:hypothetical protein